MLMNFIDKQYLETPYFGSRRMAAVLERAGHLVSRKRVQRLMRLMGIEAIYPKPNLSKRAKEHKIYPYLLKGLDINRPNYVWSTDITYIRLNGGFLYLVAIIDWFSRYVLSWRLSNSLSMDFCLEAVEDALENTERVPEFFNTDQGSQFTANEFVSLIQGAGIKISMDGKGRALDNIFIERLWRSLKYEEVYLNEYFTTEDAYRGIEDFFGKYNNSRPHQSLAYKYPREVHFAMV